MSLELLECPDQLRLGVFVEPEVLGDSGLEVRLDRLHSPLSRLNERTKTLVDLLVLFETRKVLAFETRKVHVFV